MSKELQIYDTTLRDGAQMEGISLSVDDKLKITKLLDELGVDFIEGGWPGANPKDVEFFKKVQELNLKHAKIVAFGSTRHANSKTQADPVLNALLQAKTEHITIVGKAWDMHVDVALNVSKEENLKMIQDSIEYLKIKKKKVFFDAEHYFDSFKLNPEYALNVIKCAHDTGADGIILCDTNGGSLPEEIRKGVLKAKETLGEKTLIGIHVHNDCELAVANSITAYESGARQIQGTINGIGERCGNANLVSIIANLELKYKEKILPEKNLTKLTAISRQISDILNLNPYDHQPFVGFSAFTHKGGLHASAIKRSSKTYEHIEPELVGNTNKIVVSEQSGISNILAVAEQNKIDLGNNPKETAQTLLKKVKELEHKGYQYDGASASFVLLLLELLEKRPKFYELIDYRVNVSSKQLAEATVRLKVKGEVIHAASLGVGPGNALDNALRKALNHYYPALKEFQLVDFKVRIVDSHDGSAAKTRVRVETSDGSITWDTVGLSANIIDATWLAITDSIEYGLWVRLKAGQTHRQQPSPQTL
ncbi:MAG: citramalate synthase [Candidatus Melainabacteria bacterium RIFCSPLOWO2_02_FULL_35_15]|nr:MAG: citramalate synthase [Candidatus Melainabacteria bacterium RIFCSPLOWO2_12_FULL_35_11]OGI14284.1 MAG: citramalate synthase [Candidatus Melainabacteria bacterium RIFCSPLOWO2_02_FULL_35_15]